VFGPLPDGIDPHASIGKTGVAGGRMLIRESAIHSSGGASWRRLPYTRGTDQWVTPLRGDRVRGDDIGRSLAVDLGVPSYRA